MSPESPLPPLDFGDRLMLIGLLAASVFVVSAPLVIGVAAAALVPGLGGLRAGVPPMAVAGGLMLTVVVIIWFGGPLERVSRRPFGRCHWAGTLAAEATSLGFLWLLLLPMLASGWSALLAASLGEVLYRCTEPLVDRWARKDRENAEA
jgi:nitric oxide reductase large subunit